MSEYISKQEAIKIADSYMSEDAMDIREEITLLPPADVRENVHGEWVLLDGYRCSRCNYKLQTTGLSNFCPNCGALMSEILKSYEIGNSFIAGLQAGMKAGMRDRQEERRNQWMI